MKLTHLERLEAESIHILREVVAETEKPVKLYSIGKDSAVMLHLARKAFHPSPPPFPLLHVDTTWKFKAMYDLRDRVARDSGMELIVYQNPEARQRGINPFDHGALHTDMWKTEGLKQALDLHGFDAAFGGARRDEEKSRAKERMFSFRSANHRWDPKDQRPELWNLYNARKGKGESIRVFRSRTGPSSTSGNNPAQRRADRAALFRRPAAHGRARRHAADGRRRALPAGSRRGAGRAIDPLPDAGLLSADGRGRERGYDAVRGDPGDAAHHDLRTAGPCDRQGCRRRGMEKKKQEGYF